MNATLTREIHQRLSAMAWKPAKAWTSCGPVQGYRHFRLVLHGGKGRERWVELEAVLDASTRCRAPWHELCDPERWTSGWQQLPPCEEPLDTLGSEVTHALQEGAA